MKITLDRVALRELIESDPSFELQLKSTVLSEVARRFFEKDASRDIREAAPELFKQTLTAVQENEDLVGLVNKALRDHLIARPHNFWNSVKVAPDIQKKIDEAVSDIQVRVVHGAVMTVQNAISDAIAKQVAEVMNSDAINERIAKRVDRLTNEEIDNRAKRLFAEKMESVQRTINDVARS